MVGGKAGIINNWIHLYLYCYLSHITWIDYRQSHIAKSSCDVSLSTDKKVRCRYFFLLKYIKFMEIILVLKLKKTIIGIVNVVSNNYKI